MSNVYLFRPYAKPLIVFSPKSLLHHKPSTSHLTDMTTGTFFQRVIIEGSRGDNMRLSKRISNSKDSEELYFDLLESNEISRIIFCTGKVSLICFSLLSFSNTKGYVDILPTLSCKDSIYEKRYCIYSNRTTCTFSS